MYNESGMRYKTEDEKMFKEQAKCRSEYKDGTLYAEVSGEIDHHSARSIRDTLDRDMLKYRPKALRLDLSSVSFMDSSGLGLILGRSALAEEIGACIRLTGASSRVMKILSMAGVERIENIKIEKKGEKKNEK